MSTRNKKPAGGRAAATIAAAILLVLLTAAGIKLSVGGSKTSQNPQGTATATSRLLVGLAASATGPVSRTSGVSEVVSDASGYPVNLRNSPTIPPAGAGNGDGDPAGWPIDSLATGNTVQMRCWTDSYKPAGYNSARWFYVNEVTGPHSGWSGYVFSAEIPVSQQIVTPQCTDQIVSQYMDPPADPAPAPLHFQVVGACTTAGGTLTSASSNFTPGATYSVQAFDPSGNTYPLTYDHGTVSSDGSVIWQWPCAGVPAGTYSTTLVDQSDGQEIGPVYFTVGPAPSAPASTVPVTTPSTPATSSQPAPPAPGPSTYTEEEWHTGANTFTDPDNASGMGQKIAPGQNVQVTCKLYDPSILSASPGGYWYKIASSPWDNQYYAVANTFLNGDPWAGPYTHPTDLSVPDC